MKNPNYDLLVKKAEKARNDLGISKEDAESIANAAYQLYHSIGGDLPAENKRGTIRRSSLIEVCLDAGRLEEDLKRSKQGHLADILRKAFNEGGYLKIIDLVGPSFRYAEYEAGQPME